MTFGKRAKETMPCIALISLMLYPFSQLLFLRWPSLLSCPSPKARRPPLVGCWRLFIQHVRQKFGLISVYYNCSNEFPGFTECKEFHNLVNNYQLLDISNMRLIEAFTEISECDLTFGALICTLVLP
jgi:hypothetical protein